MSKKTDKDIELEEVNKKTLTLEHQRLAEEEKAKLAAQQQIEEINAIKPKPKKDHDKTSELQEVKYSSAKPTGDWKDIVDDYKAKYDKEPDKNGALVFATAEEAETFFTDQAVLNREFLTTLVDENGKPEGDFHYFSCGNGQLYSGSLKDIHSKLQTSLEAAVNEPAQAEKIEAGIAKIEAYMKDFYPKSTPSATQTMKASLQDIKESTEQKPDQELDKEEPEYKSPTPLSTTNNPNK
ncbi:MAG: hypothetical protein H0T84_13495 [Tatlockia sp.]|nr:hypothetical protein [Tatlockia sp.]